MLGFQDWLIPIVTQFEKIVLVDDYSTDTSAEYLSALERNFDNIEVVFRNENSGRPSLPRNDGLARLPSVGRVIFLDIDDRIPYSYINFLKKANSEDGYSGVKYVTDVSDFDPTIRCSFDRKRIISARQLSRKNHIVFSGSSLPLSAAKTVKFINSPLEDWLYWQAIVRDGLRFSRLLTVPVAYNNDITLSPNKFRQIRRVYRHLGFGLLVYFAEVLRIKFEELSLAIVLRKKS